MPPVIARRIVGRVVSALAFTASLTACGKATGDSASAAAAPSRVDSLANAYWATYLDLNPEEGTALGLPNADHARIFDNRLAAIERGHARFDALRTATLAIDTAAVAGTPQEVTYAILREALESEAARRTCRTELWGVASYVNGWQAVYTDVALLQPVGSDSLRAAALTRARAIPGFIDTEIANLREGLRLGYSSPKVIVRNVMRQLDDLVATPPARSPFHSPAERDSAPAFDSALTRVIADSINPAIRRFRAFLERDYLPKAREALGVSANPEGAQCYAALLRAFSTLPISGDSVYAMGLREMEQLQGRMRTIAARSFAGESLTTLLPRLRSDPRYTFRTPQEVIDSAGAVIARGKASMPKWFGRLPKADVIVQPYPEFRQKAGAPGQYQTAPDDGSRPAIFLINPSNPTQVSRADAEATAVHEAIPGHHLQAAIAKERTDLHPLSRYLFNSGFGEGWALYAEELADEMGMYSGDLGRMGMLSSASFRAARMVIDAGIHTKGWTREQSLDYLLSHTVLPQSVAEGEIDRYISWPGQAPSYMIGKTVILGLRERARATLGSRFDIRAFHDQVLEDGSVPLSFLRTRLERWGAAPGPR